MAGPYRFMQAASPREIKIALVVNRDRRTCCTAVKLLGSVTLQS
jgi:hypothetical protein